MKKSIIKALYNGNPPPAGSDFQNGVEYGDTFCKINEIVNELKSKISEEDHHRLAELEDLRSDIIASEVDQSFKHGFCLGALLMIEIFTAENLISKAKK